MNRVKASKALVPLLCAAVGFGIGAFLYPGPYTYAPVNGGTMRVNRITGVEQYSSSHGWVSGEEAVRDSMSSAFNGMGDAFRSVGASSSAPNPGAK